MAKTLEMLVATSVGAGLGLATAAGSSANGEGLTAQSVIYNGLLAAGIGAGVTLALYSLKYAINYLTTRIGDKYRRR